VPQTEHVAGGMHECADRALALSKSAQMYKHYSECLKRARPNRAAGTEQAVPVLNQSAA